MKEKLLLCAGRQAIMSCMYTAKLFQGEAVKSACLEISKTQLDTALGTCSSWSCFEQRVGLDNLQRSCPTSTTLWENKQALKNQECTDLPKTYYSTGL